MQLKTSDLYVANSSFEFECSGTLNSLVSGSDFSSNPIFGIMVGDNYNSEAGLLGYTTIGIDQPPYNQMLVWTYKLVATHVTTEATSLDFKVPVQCGSPYLAYWNWPFSAWSIPKFPWTARAKNGCNRRTCLVR